MFVATSSTTTREATRPPGVVDRDAVESRPAQRRRAVVVVAQERLVHTPATRQQHAMTSLRARRYHSMLCIILRQEQLKY